MQYVAAAGGLVILLLAGDLLVRGAVNISLRLGVPALVVSLTIVAFGTSAPELLISISAVMDGAPGLALGNVVGSNTANVLLVLGLPALVAGLDTSHFDTRKSYLLMISASILFVAVAFLGPFEWKHGLVFLALLALILGEQVRSALAHRRGMNGEPDLESVDPGMRWWKITTYLVLGLIGLPLGATLLVDAAQIIARDFGVSDSVIGLTLVAVGTSLPELATTISAAIRRQADVALGNVIGSNLFNVLGIAGAASLFGAIPVAPQFLTFDLWVMLGASILIAPFVFYERWTLSRRWGTTLTTLYLIYIIMVVQI
ncbi:MAG: calcium/sodium antiporter [Boseongicola sp.]